MGRTVVHSIVAALSKCHAKCITPYGGGVPASLPSRFYYLHSLWAWRWESAATFQHPSLCESENTLHFCSRSATRAKTRLISAPAVLREQKHASFPLPQCYESINTLQFCSRSATRAKTRFIFAPALLRERKHASFLLLHCCGRGKELGFADFCVV